MRGYVYRLLMIVIWLSSQPIFIFSEIIDDAYELEANLFIEDYLASYRENLTPEEIFELESLGEVGIRSLIGQAVDSESKPLGIKFGNTAFSNNSFYVGASEVPSADETYALARASVQKVRNDNGTVSNQVKVIPLAGDDVKINGEQGTNPLKGQIVDSLGLMSGRYPALTIPMDGGSTLNKVIVLNDELLGKDLVTNATQELMDAANKQLADKQSVVALAASSDTVFLAIPPSGGDFGADNSGFIRFKKDPDISKGLEMQRRDGSVGQDFAYKLNLDAHKLGQPYPISPLKDSEQVQVSFTIDPTMCPYITGAQVGSDADMYWDKKLNRLYVGLSSVTGDMDQKGGALAVLVGRVDPATNVMVMQPIIPFDFIAASLPNNDLTRIVGFQHDKASKVQASAFKVRTMNTSTGKDYVILNGGVDLVANNAKLNPLVWALPLVPSKKSFTQNNEEKYIGLLASSSNRAMIAKNVSQLLSKNDLETQVGASPGYLAHNLNAFEKDAPLEPPVCDTRKFLNQTQIMDMHVVGDTVYVATAGTRDAMAREEQGIFASTAIFDEQGIIRAWTPWERVMGRIEEVLSFGVDTATLNYFYLDSSQQIIKVTQWGLGDFTSTDDDGIHNTKPLATVLDGFPKSLTGTQTFGPVYNLVNFDDETPGFKPYTKEKEFAPFSMMVATGNQKVAFIQTGKRDANKVFQQTGQFITGDKQTPSNNNVFIFNDQGLKGAPLTGNAVKDALLPKGIGEIVTAEVSRVPVDQKLVTQQGKGWVFVGGTMGLAVCKDLFGFGWSTNKNGGLDQLAAGTSQQVYAFPGKGYNFIQLFDAHGTNIFLDVRKLIADGTYLYIVTSKKIFRYQMDESDFSTGKIAAERLKIIVDTSLSLDENNKQFLFGHQISDILILDKTFNARRFLISTSVGVWINNNPLTENGTVIVNNQEVDPLSNLAWTNKVGNAAGTGSGDDLPFALGQVVNLHMIPTHRGGGFNGDVLDANVYVRAADQTNSSLSVYRFNVQNQEDPKNKGTQKVFVKAFKEPYFRDTILDYQKNVQEGNRTKEFFKVGTLSPQTAVVLDDPLALPTEFNENDLKNLLIAAHAVNPNFFLRANQDKSAIDFKQKISNHERYPQLVHDTASGAIYTPGFFGVAVNE